MYYVECHGSLVLIKRGFISSQVSYFSLIWMNHSRTLNKKINMGDHSEWKTMTKKPLLRKY